MCVYIHIYRVYVINVRTLQLIKGDLQLHRRKARASQAHKDADPQDHCIVSVSIVTITITIIEIVIIVIVIIYNNPQDNCFPMGCFAADDGHDSEEEEEED